MLRCPNGLCHVVLDVLVAPWRENYILDFSGSGTQIKDEQNTVSTKGMKDQIILMTYLGHHVL